jgi:hypothetical protein
VGAGTKVRLVESIVTGTSVECPLITVSEEVVNVNVAVLVLNSAPAVTWSGRTSTPVVVRPAELAPPTLGAWRPVTVDGALVVV